MFDDKLIGFNFSNLYITNKRVQEENGLKLITFILKRSNAERLQALLGNRHVSDSNNESNKYNDKTPSKLNVNH